MELSTSDVQKLKRLIVHWKALNSDVPFDTDSDDIEVFADDMMNRIQEEHHAIVDRDKHKWLVQRIDSLGHHLPPTFEHYEGDEFPMDNFVVYAMKVADVLKEVPTGIYNDMGEQIGTENSLSEAVEVLMKYARQVCFANHYDMDESIMVLHTVENVLTEVGVKNDGGQIVANWTAEVLTS